jgi:hypothetical protein
MAITRKLGLALALIVITVLSATLPAQAAGSTLMWSTTSKSSNIGLALEPKVALNAGVQAVSWVQRTGADSSTLNVRVLRDGVWGPREILATSQWDWWDAFDVQVSSSGKVYVAEQTVDVTMTVFSSAAAGVWVTTTVDTMSSSLGAMEVSGTVRGGVVAFTSSRADSNRSATLSTYVFDEANSGAGWVTTTVDTFTASYFSACTIKTSYYDSCAIDSNESQIAIADDGSEVLFSNVGRDSSNGNPAALQLKIFKYHRADSASAWVKDGAVYTLTLGKKDTGFSFFLSNIATTGAGKYGIALTAGSSANTVHLYTGDTFASAPVAKDATYISSLKNTDYASVVFLNDELYASFDARGAHKFGKVGSLSTTTRSLTSAKSNQEVKNLLVVGGNIVAVIDTPKAGTYLSTYTTKWSTASKVLSFGGDYSPMNGPAATDGTDMVIAAPKFSGNRMIGLYAYNN